MPLAIPSDLKKISPYIKRAEELDKDQSSPESRLVAYYLRQYAVHQGIPLAGSNPGAKTCLGHILGDLEKEKPIMANFTREESAFLCRKFAVSVFTKADDEDRMGQSGKNTAKTFYAAQSFLQMLEQFYDANDAESEQAADDKKRILYSKWKATEILKAIKEGRTPTPGGYGEDAVIPDDPEDEAVVDPAPTAAAPATAAQPTVETVHDDFGLPAPPTNTLPLQPPPLPPPEPESMDEQGTEVELDAPPPPAYPGGMNDDEPAPSSRSDRPALAFDLPTVDMPPPSPAKAKSSLFGFIKKGSAKNASKAQITDAMELTKFALSALEEKDGELAVERLQQALSALQR